MPLINKRPSHWSPVSTARPHFIRIIECESANLTKLLRPRDKAVVILNKKYSLQAGQPPLKFIGVHVTLILFELAFLI